MYERPNYSPWGSLQTCHKLCAGVYTISTASHGGIMVNADMADAILSEAAVKCAFRYNRFLCFEEDCDANVALRELLDKKLISKAFNLDAEQLGKIVNRSLQQWHPAYWQAREKALAKAEKEHSPKAAQHTKEDAR